ncbi:transposase [Escherichia coli]|nr:transposase [Escherichia coli]
MMLIAIKEDIQHNGAKGLKWFTEFGHLNRGDMLTSEQHRCHNEKKKFQRRV